MRTPEELKEAVARHKRLRRDRGSAAVHLCEGGCQGRAREWAQIHGTDGLDFWKHYVPLCRSCHIQYDYESRWNEESLAKWRENASRGIAAAWTPERRANQSRYARETRKMHPTIQDPVTGRFVGVS